MQEFLLPVFNLELFIKQQQQQQQQTLEMHFREEQKLGDNDSGMQIVVNDTISIIATQLSEFNAHE
jgi:hypothetical protein